MKSLRLAWLKRVLNGSKGTWKRYLQHQLDPSGGFFIFNCNYDVSDYAVSSQFYNELLLWLSQFRETFVLKRDWRYIIWNNKETNGIIYTYDLLFHLNMTDSYTPFSKMADILLFFYFN